MLTCTNQNFILLSGNSRTNVYFMLKTDIFSIKKIYKKGIFFKRKLLLNLTNGYIMQQKKEISMTNCLFMVQRDPL